MEDMLSQFLIVMPELGLVLIALFMQIAAVCFRSGIKFIITLSIILSIGVLLLICQTINVNQIGFHDSFIVNHANSTFKAVTLGLTITTLIMYRNYCKISAEELRAEFVGLILLSTVGLFLAISARNFLLLFCGLELQSLSSYALAAFNINSSKSSEAGLKYFILGALVSCISLLGISFIYGFGGSLDYSVILPLLGSGNVNIGLVIGVVLMLTEILFKFSAAPLHVWTPDVYEGAPIIAVTYFSTAQKIGVLAILLNVLTYVAGNYTPISVNIIRIIAILSMIIGAVGAIRQTSLKRLMAYSTVLNIGYVLIGVCLHNASGNFVAILYMVIYIISVTGFFACLIALLGRGAEEANFEDIKGIAFSRKALAGGIAIIMFSMIGLPPLAGFFGKYYVFYQAIAEGEFTLAFIGILTSVIAAYYYLKVIKVMYFSERLVEIERIPTSNGLLFVTCLAIGFILFFSFISDAVLQNNIPVKDIHVPILAQKL